MSRKCLARIVGMGSYLPEKVLTNRDLEEIVDTSDEWIYSRTGMKERRIAEQEESSSDMAVAAARKALDETTITPESIDLVLVATATPDYLMPSTAAIVQAKIGAVHAAAFDLQAACTGYLYAISTAKAYIESGMYRVVLVVAVDKMSAFVDYQDRSTCVLFGDGASASIIAAEGAGFAIESLQLGADGALHELIVIPAGGSRLPFSKDTLSKRQHFFKMTGKEVYKHAVRKMKQVAKQCLEKAGVEEKQVSWLIPHQANQRIIDALAKHFQIPMNRVGITVHKYGNTSGSSVAITLDEVQRQHTLNPEERLLLVAFGSGLTWGACLLRACSKSSSKDFEQPLKVKEE